MSTYPEFTGGEPCSTTDPDMWVPERHSGWADAVKAKRLCKTCPTFNPCLSFALADASLEGIYAGTTTKERQQMRRRSS